MTGPGALWVPVVLAVSILAIAVGGVIAATETIRSRTSNDPRKERP